MNEDNLTQDTIVTMWRLPLIDAFDQSFSATFRIDGRNRVQLRWRFRYNWVGDFWWMTIMNARDNSIIIDGIPLIEGYELTENIMQQYVYKSIGGCRVRRIAQVPGRELDDRPRAGDFPLNYEVLWTDTFEGVA